VVDIDVTVLALVAAIYVALVGGMYTFQRSMMYLPSTTTPSPAASGVPDMAPVTLKTADGLNLMSWYRAAADGRPTIVYFHGNGGHIGYRGFKVRPYLDAGYGLLLVSYRGYGGNPGKPTEQGLYQDGRAAMAFLETQGVEPGKTVLFGESLGSGVAVQIAVEQASDTHPVAAVVLEAPPSSITDVAAHHYFWAPVRWLLKDRFESKAKIAHVNAPVLIVHGEGDQVVPIRFGKALFAAAVDPKRAVWVAGAGHENLDRFGGYERVLEFLQAHTETGG
jgi:hypothetical protein